MVRRIYCPRCRRHLGTYDGKSGINKIMHCKNCNVRVVFDVETESTEITKIPPRVTSSGKTFY